MCAPPLAPLGPPLFFCGTEGTERKVSGRAQRRRPETFGEPGAGKPPSATQRGRFCPTTLLNPSQTCPRHSTPGGTPHGGSRSRGSGFLTDRTGGEHGGDDGAARARAQHHPHGRRHHHGRPRRRHDIPRLPAPPGRRLPSPRFRFVRRVPPVRLPPHTGLGTPILAGGPATTAC